MTDILPTGFSTAMNARRLADEDRTPHGPQTGTAGPLSKRGVCLVVGCGPVRYLSSVLLTAVKVGLCAITSATTLFEHVFATDLSAARLELAKKHGAQALQKSELVPALMSATEGRGADAVLELVGVQAALDTALELVRPYGVVSVGGVHTKEIKLPGLLLYGKKYVTSDLPADNAAYECNSAVAPITPFMNRLFKFYETIETSSRTLWRISSVGTRQPR